MEQQIQAYMFTEIDFNAVKAHFQQAEPKLAQLMERHGYLPPLPTRNLFSHLIGAILGQKIRFRRARLFRQRLYQKLGSDCFQPDDILTIDLAGLLELGMDVPIAELIIRVSQWVDQLVGIEPFNHPEQLLKLREEVSGIGPWTVNNTAIIWTLSRDENENNNTNGAIWDYLLTEDLIIRRTLKKLFPMSHTVSQQQELGQSWAPYRGVITWYLWREGTS